MNKVPKKLKEKWNNDMTPRFCARHNEGNCQGRLTKEHVIIYAGRQLQEDWAILDLCEFHHGVLNFQDRGDLNKEINEWYVLNKATDQELLAVSKVVNYLWRREALNKVYGKPR